MFEGAHHRHEIPNRPQTDLITPDATSGPAEWGRYHDAVREAARSFDNPKEGDIHHFLQARAREPDKVDVPAFHEAVHRHRMADIVDIVDHHMRRDGSLPRGARMVRTQAPRGYMRRAIRNMGSEDLAHLRHRLGAIGHQQEHVDDYLAKRANPDMWDQASALEVRLSEGEFLGLEFDDSDSGWSGESEAVPLVVNVYVNGQKAETEIESEAQGG